MSTSHSKPTLLGFTAEWCHTCKALNASVKKHLSPEYGDKVEFLEIDVNQREDMAEKYDILSLPTLILLAPNGETVWRGSGMIDPAEIKKWLNYALTTKP